MITLSDYIGEILYDISKARNYADNNCALLSEKYYADPFTRNLPVPHYLIEDVEINFPVMVIGIEKTNGVDKKFENEIIDAINDKLPILLIRSYKYNFIKTKTQELTQRKLKLNIKEQENKELNKKDNLKSHSPDILIDDNLLSQIETSAKNITATIVTKMSKFISSYNYDIFKLLDLSNEFSKYLYYCIKDDIVNYDNEHVFNNNKEINNCSNYIGNIMFFEFKNIVSSDSGVQVDISSSGMNEYSGNDCLMHIKLKIKEQDMTLLIEDDNGKEKRYLSLI